MTDGANVRPGANDVYHVAGKEETLCGRACAGWYYPFRASGLGTVDGADKTFCTPCVSAYAAETGSENDSD